MSQDALITVVHAFRKSRLDFCNSLLYGIVDYNINQLQQIKRDVAPVVTNNGK